MNEYYTTPLDRRTMIRWAIVIAGAVSILVGLSMSANASDRDRGTVYLSHPAGCPARSFCACGAAVKVFGRNIRSLWPSSAWFKFPRSAPGHMTVAVRRGHVFVIDYMIDAGTAMAWDFNSGNGQSRYHPRKLRGFAVVNPLSSRMASR